MHRVRHELGTVVEPHVVRCPVLQNQAIQHGDDTIGVDATVDFDRHCFAGELVDHVQHLHGAAVGCGVELKVHRPNDIRTDR